MKSLVFMEDNLQTDLISLAIESFFEEIESINTSKKIEFTDQIKKTQLPTIFVTDQISAAELTEFSKLLNVYICAVGSYEEISFDSTRTITISSIQKMGDLMESLLQICPQLRPLPENRYSKISIKTLLLNRGKFNVDVYIRLSETKYVKAINIGDTFGTEDFKKYSARNISFLYIKSNDFLFLIDDWMSELKMLSSNIHSYSIDRITDTFSSIHESIHYMIRDEGFTPAMQDLANASINLAVATMSRNPKLSELMETLKNKKIPYISAHSTAIVFLSCKLANFLDWSNETTFFRLGMAAYIHDLTLEKDEFALLETKKAIESSHYSEDEKKTILTHSKTAAALLKGDNSIPLDVTFIVEQHHESGDGTGFPKGVTTEISPISALFILAHDIVTAMYKSEESFDLNRFLRLPETTSKYCRGNSAKVFKQVKDRIMEEEQ